MSDEQTPGQDGADDDAERRRRSERRSLIDLTRAERGEPERRRLPGVERRDLREDDDRPE